MSRIETLAEGVTLYLGDCRQILPTLGNVDAVVTDPPYGIGFKYDSHVDDPTTYPQFIWPIIEEAEKHVLPGGPIFVWQAQLRIRDLPQIFPREWRLFIGGRNFAQLQAGPMQHSYDPIICWWKEGEKPWKLPSSMNRDWFISDTATFVNDKSSLARQHPCPRPIDVCEYIAKTWCNPAGIILDPFMGSGTTGVAGVNLGRKFIGIEIEPKYFDIACRRISEALKQTDLFIEKPAPLKQKAML